MCVYTHTRTHTYLIGTHAHKRSHTHRCMHTCTHVHMHAHTYARTYAHMPMRAKTQTHACRRANIHAHGDEHARITVIQSRTFVFPCKVGLVFMQIFPIRSFYVDLQVSEHLKSLFRPMFCMQIHNIPSFCRLCISSLTNNMAPSTM